MRIFKFSNFAGSALPNRNRAPWGLLLLATFAAFLAGAFAGLFGGLVALLLTLFAIFAVVAIGDYRVGVLLAMFLLPLSATRIMPHQIFGLKGLNPLNLLILLSVFSVIVTRPFMRKALSIPRLPRMLWVFIGVLTLWGLYGALSVAKIPAYYQAMQMVSFDSAFGYLRDVLLRPLLFLLLAYMVAMVVANTQRPHLILVPLFLSSIILPILVMLLVAKSGFAISTLASAKSRNFLSVLGVHANELGLMFNMAFALGLFLYFELRSVFVRVVLAIVLGIVLVGIVLTFSRGAFLGTITTVCYFLVSGRRFRTAAGVLALTVVAALLMPSAVVERASVGVASGNVGQISAGRVDSIWLPLLPEVVRSPVIGHGMSSILWSDAARNRAILPVGHPHSAYIGVLLDFGLIGGVLIFLFYRSMWRYFRELATSAPDPVWRGFFRGAMGCILLLLVQGVTDDRFTPTFPQIFLWLSLGFAIGMTKRSELLPLPSKQDYSGLSVATRI